MKLVYGIFYTNNIQVVKKFYEQTLGLELAFDDDNFVSFNIGDALLGIKKASKTREIPGSQTIIISIPDIEDIYSKLTESGVEFYKELSEESWGKNFAILDPDGNKIEFTAE